MSKTVLTSTTRRLFVLFILMAAWCSSRQFAAYAEGGPKRPPGDWGVNRRVITQAPPTGSYIGVKGIFDGINFSLPKDVSGRVTAASNIANSKPTFYLGGSGGGVEVDAGFQYEWDIIGGLPPGWSAFISKNGVFCSPKYFAVTNAETGEGEWRAWRGSNSTSKCSLEYKVWNGTDTFRGALFLLVRSA